MKKNYKILLLILIFAAAIRFVGIERTLINDEVVWASTVKNFVTTGEPLQYLHCNSPLYFYWHPPIGLLTYSLSTSILGFSNFAFRLFPVIFGIATIIVTFYLGKELYSEKVGLLAAFLMAVSRYHIFYSQNVDVDGSFLAFYNVATVLFFVLYKKRNEIKFAYISGIFLILSLLTKFSGFLPLIAMLLYSYLLDKKNFKKDFFYLMKFSIISMVILFTFSLLMNDIRFFQGPVEYFTQRVAGQETSLSQIIYNKAFYVATVTWQLIPFLFVLGFLAILKVKRDEKFYLLSSWFLIVFIVFMIPYGLDIQRYFAAALAPVFILISKYILDQIKMEKKSLYLISFTVLPTLFLAYTFEINDLLGYQNPVILAIVYIVAFSFLMPTLPRKYSIAILIGSYIGLSSFLLIGLNSWHSAQSFVVDDLVKNVNDMNLPKNEVWGNKDVKYYLTQENETMNYCFPDLNETFLKENKVKYISVYYFRGETDLIAINNYCKEPREVILFGRKVGLTCELKNNV